MQNVYVKLVINDGVLIDSWLYEINLKYDNSRTCVGLGTVDTWVPGSTKKKKNGWHLSVLSVLLL